MTKLKRRGENGQPCLHPVWIEKGEVVPQGVRTVHFISDCTASIILSILSEKPSTLSDSLKASYEIVSKAFRISVETTYSGELVR